MALKSLPGDFNPRFLDRLDGRTVMARVIRERLAELYSDLGGESASYAQKSLCKRSIWLESWLETQEASAAEGGEVDIGRQVQAVNSYLGILRTLGIERRASTVPDIQTYLRQRAEQAEA